MEGRKAMQSRIIEDICEKGSCRQQEYCKKYDHSRQENYETDNYRGQEVLRRMIVEEYQKYEKNKGGLKSVMHCSFLVVSPSSDIVGGARIGQLLV